MGNPHLPTTTTFRPNHDHAPELTGDDLRSDGFRSKGGPGSGRRRWWPWVAALAALSALVALLLVLLPEGLKRLIATRVSAATGLHVTIQDIDFNPFTGRLAIKELQLSGRDDGQPLVELHSLRGRIVLFTLLSGHLRIKEGYLAEPIVRLKRTGPGTFNFSNLLHNRGTSRTGIGIDVTVEEFKLVDGRVVFTDTAVSPTTTWSAQNLSLVAHDLSTAKHHDGGSAEIGFRIRETPVSLRLSGIQLTPAQASIGVHLQGFALQSLLPYLPRESALALTSGRLGANVVIHYASHMPIVLNGTLTVNDLHVQRENQRAPFITAPDIRAKISGLKVMAGGVTVNVVELSGTPSLIDEQVSPVAHVALSRLDFVTRDVTWPEQGPAKVQVSAQLQEGGKLAAEGHMAFSPWAADVQLEVDGVPLTPFRPYLPIRASVTGLLNGVVHFRRVPNDVATVIAEGSLSVRNLNVGSSEAPLLTVTKALASGVELRWPSRLRVRDMRLAQPFLRIERQADYSFPWRHIVDRSSVTQDMPAGPKMQGIFDRITVSDGSVLFLDRTTSPDFSEELTHLSLTLADVRTSSKQRARLNARAQLASGGELHLHGAIGPRLPVYADLTGKLKTFPVPATNPYWDKLLAWIAHQGELSTTVHYKIEGNHLKATNDITIKELSVSRAGGTDEVERHVGLPLGLIVSLLKDVHGDIHLKLPVSGDISRPQFSFSEAAWQAFRNAVVRVVSGPFRLIGRILTGPGNTIKQVQIEPVQFEAGTPTLAPQMGEHLQRLGEFAAQSPEVRLAMTPIISNEDIASLKIQTVIERAQAVKREIGADKIQTATTRLYVESFPDRVIPPTESARIEQLSQEEPVPFDAARRLAQERADTVREALESHGVRAEQLGTAEEAVPSQPGPPRVEFRLATGH
jgi:hypothetical protein